MVAENNKGDRRREGSDGGSSSAAKFGRRAVSGLRYGRATLTIRRWGGWSELLADNDLSRILEAYRDRQADAAAVAAAFVRARVQSHSPTFQWENADPDRLLAMVVAYSTEPKFEEADQTSVAEVLLEARDDQREKARVAGAQFVKSMESAFADVRLIGQRVAESAAEAVRLASAPSRAAIEALSQVSRPFAVEKLTQMVASLPKLEPEAPFSKSLFAGVSGASVAPLRLSTLNLQQFAMPDLAKALLSIANARPAVEISAFFKGYAGRQTFELDEVFSAARSASGLVAQLGAKQTSQALSNATTDAEDAVAAPELRKIQQSLDGLADLIAESERQRRADREDDADANVVLWAVSILIALYLALLPYATGS